MACGDVISQCVIERKSMQNIEFIRTARFFAIGFVYVVSLALYCGKFN